MSDNNRRVQVLFTEEQYEFIKKFKGELGSSDAEVVRNIVIAWLTEKSFISTKLKNKIFIEDVENGQS